MRFLKPDAFGLAVIIAVALAVAAQADSFSPQRQFPTSWDHVQVFVDQLDGGPTTAQKQFAASHYAGTQKQTSNLIDAIRAYNPNFIMLQYRLGSRESGEQVPFIHNDSWSSDWATINAHQDWFVHDSQNNRVYQLYGGNIHEYVMDISGTINGNTTNGWKEYWSTQVQADVIASHGDGVFADSTHLPYAVPSDLWDSPIGSPPHTAYIDDMNAFYAYTYQRFIAANQYFIPNISGLTTTLDTTTGYYTNVHGAMVEGAGTKASNGDWKLQQNRTLNLIRNDKIYIAQNIPNENNIADRVWQLANFLLLRHHKSFLNINGSEGQLSWYPEYDLMIGEPLDKSVPASIDGRRDASGIYFRRYEKGLVLVNPTNAILSFQLGASDPHLLATPFGGGGILPDGTVAHAMGWNYDLQGSSITLQPWTAAILVPEPAATGWAVAAVAMLIRRRRSSSATRPRSHEKLDAT
jgi:hypothetical protein